MLVTGQLGCLGSAAELAVAPDPAQPSSSGTLGEIARGR